MFKIGDYIYLRHIHHPIIAQVVGFEEKGLIIHWIDREYPSPHPQDNFRFELLVKNKRFNKLFKLGVLNDKRK